jgi:hypothetical protein
MITWIHQRHFPTTTAIFLSFFLHQSFQVFHSKFLISWLYYIICSFADFYPFFLRVITWMPQRRFPTSTSSFSPTLFIFIFFVIAKSFLFAGRVWFQQVSHILATISWFCSS